MESRIGEINIVCTDAERSLRFYRDILGFQVVAEEEGAWQLTNGNTRFLLLPFAGVERRPPKYCSEPCISFDILVPDLERAKAYLESHGVEIDRDYPPNAERFFIRDPDGLVLEVVQA